MRCETKTTKWIRRQTRAGYPVHVRLRYVHPHRHRSGHSTILYTETRDILQKFFFCRCLRLCVDLGPIQRDDACQRFNVGHLIQNRAENMAYGGSHAFLMSDHWGIRA